MNDKASRRKDEGIATSHTLDIGTVFIYISVTYLAKSKSCLRPNPPQVSFNPRQTDEESRAPLKRPKGQKASLESILHTPDMERICPPNHVRALENLPDKAVLSVCQPSISTNLLYLLRPIPSIYQDPRPTTLAI